MSHSANTLESFTTDATHLEELSEHEFTGDLHRVDLKGRATVADAAVSGARSHTQHHGLGGAQQLVVHLVTFTQQGSEDQDRRNKQQKHWQNGRFTGVRRLTCMF